MTRAIIIAVALFALMDCAAADEPINTLPADERRAYAEQALDFTQCAGFYSATADIGREVGRHPDEIQLAEGLARGAQLVAQLLTAMAMPDPRQASPFARNQVENNRATWRAMLRGPGGNPRVKEWAERCYELNALQAEIIGEMRKGALTQ